MSGIKYCRACNSEHVKMFFDLGVQPFANALIKNEKESENTYPLSLSYCSDCSLVQLEYTADPTELFSNYFWITSTSSTAREYSKIFYKNAIERVQSTTDISYVLEIASNDGTFLKPFKENNLEVLGIDPAENIAKMANESGIPTKNEFFGESIAEKIITEKGYPSITFARNVLPHVADLHDFVQGLKCCLNDKGLLILEVHYSGKIMDELHYDSIYHEHLCYFTLKSLENILNLYGLYAFDIEQSPISGGSIVLYISQSQKKRSEKLIDFEAYEQKNRYNAYEKWEQFAKKSAIHRDLLNEIVDGEIKKGKKIIGYGASARSSTMLNFCRIDKDKLLKIADQNQMKQGLYTPGSHIEIITPQKAFELNPDTVVLLAWNFRDEIIDIIRDKYGFEGDVIIPLPFPPVKESM